MSDNADMPLDAFDAPAETDESAFLAAITAAPLDAAPRLVYADWLIEQGRDPEATYVRADVGIAESPDFPNPLHFRLCAECPPPAGYFPVLHFARDQARRNPQVSIARKIREWAGLE